MVGNLGSFDWANHTARMINCIGHDDLLFTSLETLADLVKFDHTGIFLFHERNRPRDLLSRHHDGTCHRTYCASTYLLDPFYKAAQRPLASGIYRMSEADRSFEQYLRGYEMGLRLVDFVPRSRQDGLGHGACLGEEIGYLLPVGGNRILHIALIRSTAYGRFDEDEIETLRGVTPVLQAVFESHFRKKRLASAEDANEDETPIDLLAGKLTPREFEIVVHLSRGLSTEEIARRMAIAAGTVKVHRKNIYRKLGVSSRGELLSIC